MNWDKGFSAQYYAGVVDAPSWRDVSTLEITGGSIKRSYSSALKESADINCVNYSADEERWLRIWLDARQGESAVHQPLFTGLAICPDKDRNGNLVSNKIECYSVLKPAQDVYLLRGWYAPAGMNGAALVKQLLAVTPAPVYTEENSPALQQAIIAEENETHLSMALKIVSAINWRIKINGLGEITVCPMATDLSATFDHLENDVVQTEIKESYDWFSCPNVVRAVMDDISAVARDDSLNSKLSTVNRGREVWHIETDCDLNDGESIAEYSFRRLKELQQPAKTLSYDRRFFPQVTVSDIIRLHYPKQQIDGLFFVNEQSIALGESARTSEEVMNYG